MTEPEHAPCPWCGPGEVDGETFASHLHPASIPDPEHGGIGFIRCWICMTNGPQIAIDYDTDWEPDAWKAWDRWKENP